MTSRMVRGGPDAKFPGELTAIIISCDNIDCQTSVDDKFIMAHGGLKAMGWGAVVLDGRLHHYCPEHRH